MVVFTESSKGQRPIKSSKGHSSARSNIQAPRSPRSARSTKSTAKQVPLKDYNTFVAKEHDTSGKFGQNKPSMATTMEKNKSSSNVVPSQISYPVLSPIPPSSPQHEVK